MVDDGRRAALEVVRVSPYLVVSDLERAIGYYKRKLGFETVFQQMDFAMVVRDGARVLLLLVPEAVQSFSSGIEDELPKAYFLVSDVRAMYEELTDSGAKVRGEPIMMPWGRAEFQVKDVDEHVLVFGELSETYG